MMQPPNYIRNANFELGRNGDWREASSDGRALITTNHPVLAAHSGSWIARLGGRVNEVSTISQTLTLPAVAPGYVLDVVYWYHREGQVPACFDDPVDEGEVRVYTPDDQWEQDYDLCSQTDVPAWDRGALDVTRFAGQTVTIEIRADSIGAVAGEFYVDDLSFDMYCNEPQCL